MHTALELSQSRVFSENLPAGTGPRLGPEAEGPEDSQGPTSLKLKAATPTDARVERPRSPAQRVRAAAAHTSRPRPEASEAFPPAGKVAKGPSHCRFVAPNTRCGWANALCSGTSTAARRSRYGAADGRLPRLFGRLARCSSPRRLDPGPPGGTRPLPLAVERDPATRAGPSRAPPPRPASYRSRSLGQHQLSRAAARRLALVVEERERVRGSPTCRDRDGYPASVPRERGNGHLARAGGGAVGPRCPPVHPSQHDAVSAYQPRSVHHNDRTGTGRVRRHRRDVSRSFARGGRGRGRAPAGARCRGAGRGRGVGRR